MTDADAITFIPAIEPPADAARPGSGEPLGRCCALSGPNLRVWDPGSPALGIPEWDDLRRHDLPALRWQYLGTLDGEPCWSAELVGGATPPPGSGFVGLRELYGRMPDIVYALAGRAAQLVAWERDHQFCGRCGARAERVPGERAMRCPDCHLSAYPRVSPAIITLIERGDRILLARSPSFAPGRYGIIAGFVEPGESLEEAVQREAREEVGIELEHIDYFGSQPWPFPHGIMVGFRASHLHGEIQFPDGELEDAGWFGLDDLPDIPAKLSIARRLIDDWAARRGAVIDRP
jgi:NAD+ diphosphatase